MKSMCWISSLPNKSEDPCKDFENAAKCFMENFYGMDLYLVMKALIEKFEESLIDSDDNVRREMLFKWQETLKRIERYRWALKIPNCEDENKQLEDSVFMICLGVGGQIFHLLADYYGADIGEEDLRFIFL